MTSADRKKLLWLFLAVLAIGTTVLTWDVFHRSESVVGLVSGNGRIEATEIDIATKLGGRVLEILAQEGEFVAAGQEVARMQIDVLTAQRDEALAQQEQAINGVTIAEAQVAVRESELAAAKAVVSQRESELAAAKGRLARSKALSREKAVSMQQYEDDRAAMGSAEASLAAARAQVAAVEAAVVAARAQIVGARSGVAAIKATIARIDADIADSRLKAPRAGRIQYRIAQPREVLGIGGKVMNMVDLSDVYMTFFLPETAAGKVALGSEVRLVLDAAPDYVIPARISFVASVAQFTPKTVETASERQKLMFRVKARIDPELLKRHQAHVKTGLPGVAWLKLDPQAEWPQNLKVKVPQ